MREPATIMSVRSGPEDHGVNTCWVMLDFDDGGHQGFGGLALSEDLLKSFESDLFWLFGTGCAVMTFGPGGERKCHGVTEQLVGQRCYVLRSFGGNSDIVGLESVSTGRIMTIHGWRRRNNVGPTATPLQEEHGRIVNDIRWHMRRLHEQQQRLAKLDDGYIHWEEDGMERKS